MTDATPNELHVAIAEVMAELTRLEEKGRNQQQNYSYVTESDIFDAIRAPLAQRGVTIIQEHGEITEQRDTQTRGGGTMHEVVVAFHFHVTHGPSGTRETFTFYGVGGDTGDKWYTKASTSAAKFFVRRMFLISAGGSEDPDAAGYERERAPRQHQRVQQPPRESAPSGPKPVSQAQLRRLYATARQHGATSEDVRRLTWVVTGARTTHANELPSGKGGPYDKAVAALETWQESAGKVADWIADHPISEQDDAAAHDTPPPEGDTPTDPPEPDIPPEAPDADARIAHWIAVGADLGLTKTETREVVAANEGRGDIVTAAALKERASKGDTP